MKKQTNIFTTLAAIWIVVGGITVNSFAWTDDNGSDSAPSSGSAGTVAMPISESDKLPDFEQPSRSRALSDQAIPDGDSFNNSGYEFVLVILNRSPNTDAMAPSLAQPGETGTDLMTGRPMDPTRRPDPSDMQPVDDSDGTNAVWMNVLSSDGSVAPELGDYDSPAVSVDPMVLIGDDGDVNIQSDDPYTSKNLLLMGGNLRARNLTLGTLPAKLELDAVRFNVTDAVNIEPKCEIITHVRNTPAGLDFEEGALLDIANSGRIRLMFHSAPNVEGIHWGMRAVGDRQVEFKQLIESGKIVVGLVYNGTVTNSPAVVIFDGQYTYITIDLPKFDRPVHSEVNGYVTDVPEPMTLSLLALGGVALLKRRK
jgi:hypothetical protein